MKYLLFLLLLVLVVSCKYKKDGEIVKDSYGNLYRLEKATADDSYFLRPIDSLQLKNLMKK